MAFHHSHRVVSKQPKCSKISDTDNKLRCVRAIGFLSITLGFPCWESVALRLHPIWKQLEFYFTTEKWTFDILCRVTPRRIHVPQRECICHWNAPHGFSPATHPRYFMHAQCSPGRAIRSTFDGNPWRAKLEDRTKIRSTLCAWEVHFCETTPLPPLASLSKGHRLITWPCAVLEAFLRYGHPALAYSVELIAVSFLTLSHTLAILVLPRAWRASRWILLVYGMAEKILLEHDSCCVGLGLGEAGQYEWCILFC